MNKPINKIIKYIYGKLESFSGLVPLKRSIFDSVYSKLVSDFDRHLVAKKKYDDVMIRYSIVKGLNAVIGSFVLMIWSAVVYKLHSSLVIDDSLVQFVSSVNKYILAVSYFSMYMPYYYIVFGDIHFNDAQELHRWFNGFVRMLTQSHVFYVFNIIFIISLFIEKAFRKR